MPGYGVPDGPQGLLPWSWAQERLVRTRGYWLVTSSASGRPHALPVWGVWLADHEVFAFSCSAASRKARNIAANPQVVVTTDDTVECVSVEGLAQPCTGALLDDMITAYTEKYEPDASRREVLGRFARSHAVFAVLPERAFAMIDRAPEFSERATKWVWP